MCIYCASMSFLCQVLFLRVKICMLGAAWTRRLTSGFRGGLARIDVGRGWEEKGCGDVHVIRGFLLHSKCYATSFFFFFFLIIVVKIMMVVLGHINLSYMDNECWNPANINLRRFASVVYSQTLAHGEMTRTTVHAARVTSYCITDPAFLWLDQFIPQSASGQSRLSTAIIRKYFFYHTQLFVYFVFEEIKMRLPRKTPCYTDVKTKLFISRLRTGLDSQNFHQSVHVVIYLPMRQI